MDHFNYDQNQLFAEDVAIEKIAAQFGTPCYVYSRATLERHWKAFDDSLGEHPHLICYAVKANSNLAVLNLFARMDSGFDIVSLGELGRVLEAGGDASKIVFSGVGKLEHEIACALEVGILCFNIESASELERINQIASQLGKVAPISLRINPDIDAKTHPYISTGLKENKFGIEMDNAVSLYLHAAQLSHIKIIGMDCHIGSQLTDLNPFIDALDKVLGLIDELKKHNITISHLDLGGGLGVRYNQEDPPLPADYAKALLEKTKDYDLTLVFEPGRAIAANAGILVTRVEYIKSTKFKNFAIIDAAMNDLLRPALYDAWQSIIPINKHNNAEKRIYDIVGPVCETGDFLGKDRELAINAGDLLAVRSSGAYGFTMSSNYNSRCRAAEVMVDGNNVSLIRERETIQQLFAGEHIISF